MSERYICRWRQCWFTERNRILKSADLPRFIEWANARGTRFRDDLQAEMTMHKMITALPDLPDELRRRSIQWLQRGFHTLSE